mmetsp:Transcript_22641/g.20120  ORF Transcript_22641/g.20120 Transcript_22641/m.20120 type:complete len:185 (+) Transcript_22641:187-741(+)
MMLTYNPKKRISAEIALKHPWFGLITEIKLNKTVKKEQKVRSKTMKKLKNFKQMNPFRRCALELLINMLSVEEKLYYETEFNKFDSSRTGMISEKDFIAKFQETEVDLPQKEIKKIMKEIIPDIEAQISFSDFLIATLEVKKLLTKGRLKTIFNKFDANDEKIISFKELEITLSSLNYPVPAKE